MVGKKSVIQMELIAYIVIGVVSFMLLALLFRQYFGSAEGKTSEAICKGSVVARESAKLNLGPVEFKSVPLLCNTQDINIKPVGKDEVEQRNYVMKQVADRMVNCWNMFGEGLVPDVFDGSTFSENKCLSCYTFNVLDGSDFAEAKGEFNGVISSEDFLTFITKTPYNIESGSDECLDFGGFCVKNSDSDLKSVKDSFSDGSSGGPDYWRYDKGNSVCKDMFKDASGDDRFKANGCLYNRFSCPNKGGSCESGSCGDMVEIIGAAGWDCPGDLKCCVEGDKYFTYKNYIQFHGGKGLSFIGTDIKAGSAERYSIAFADVSKECENSCWFKEVAVGVAAGAIAAPLIIGTGGIGLIPIIVGGAALGGTVGWTTVNVETSVENLLKWRDLPTVYLTDVDDLGEQCSVYKG